MSEKADIRVKSPERRDGLKLDCGGGVARELTVAATEVEDSFRCPALAIRDMLKDSGWEGKKELGLG